MSHKKDTIEFKYLPKLEDRIHSAFNNVKAQVFPSYSLTEDEEKELKQMLKFLLSKKSLDAATKRLGVKRTYKLLTSSNQKEIAKGKLVIEVLKRLRENKLVKLIYDSMPISQEVIDFTRALSVSDVSYQERIGNLQNILELLNKERVRLTDIKKKVSQFTKDTVVRVSESGEAVDFILKFSCSPITKFDETNDELASCRCNLFIYVGDLELKLSKVKAETWNRIIKDKSIRKLICYYTPTLKSGLDGYVCKTLQEVCEMVKNYHRGSRQSKA